MGKINVDYDVLNQKGSPAWYSDLFANIPTPGYTGRMFISTDTFAFYRDNGTGWDLTGGPGIGTITGSGVSGQVSFFSGTQVLGGSTNLVWDNTNNRLGIGVASPTVTLEISGSVKATALVKSGGTSAQILLADGTTTPTSTFQAAITLTTTGTTGASTLVGATLNVPTYTFVSSVSALTLGTSGTDLTSTVANSTTTPTITLNVPTASATNRGALSSADFTTFSNKQATITLTTTGTSGAATLVGATLNIPNYTNVGTVTSVAALTLGTSGTDLSSSVANSTSTPVITLNVPTASATNRGALSSADWSTFNSKQATISVTAPVVLTGATISMPAATTSVNGYLTSTDWNTFNNKSNTNGTVTSVVALTIGTSGIDITSTAVTTTTTPVITLNIPTASATNRGALSSTDFTTFSNKQATITLTTTGTSGVATFSANTLNIPNYGSALSGYLPLSGGTLTGPLNGTSATFSNSVTSSFNGFYGLGGYGLTSYEGASPSGKNIQFTLAIFNSIDGIYQSSGNTNDFGIWTNGGTSSQPKLYIKNGGNVAIGTNSPTALLHLVQSTSNLNIYLQNTLGSGKTWAVNSDSNGSFNIHDTTANRLTIASGGDIYVKTAGAGIYWGASQTADIFVSPSTNSMYIEYPTGYSAIFRTQGGTQSLELASTGAATFSNAVNVNNSISPYGILNVKSNSTTAFAGVNIYSATNANFIYINHDANVGIIGTEFTTGGSHTPLTIQTGGSERIRISTAGVFNATSRGNYLGATDNALFSLNSGGTLYTVGFSPTATASSTNTFTLTTGTTTWIYTGTGTATWTLPNPSGNNQIYWIKNAGTGAITLTAYSGTNIINNSAASVSTISIAVGATAVIAQDGNVKSYQLQ